MRDHRRRVEIRLSVVKTEFDECRKLAENGKVKLLGDAGLRARAWWSLGRIAYFLTDDPVHDGTSYFPREFQRANPRVPWKALADLYDRMHRQGRYDSPHFWRRRETVTPQMLWTWASVRVPRIARLLESPNQPKRWYREPHGSLGIEDVLEPHRAGIRRVMRKYGLKRFRVFGSVARGEADEKSDVDVIVDRDRRRRFLPYEIEPDLEKVVGRRVSVYTEDSLYHAPRERVLSELVEFATVGGWR